MHSAPINPFNFWSPMQTLKTIQMACVAVAVGAAFPATAQTAPDAGQTLQQLQPPLAAPRENQALTISPQNSGTPVQPGGPTVTLGEVRFQGNSVLSADVLNAALADARGKQFDLAGLRGLAERISAVYRAKGYPFARAVLPPQDLQAGHLLIEVIEGRYGKVTTPSDDGRLAAVALPFAHSLKPGAVIEAAALERSTLILDDLPGIKTSPLIRPGTEPGTGDLEVRVTRDQRVTGDAGLDNNGNRFTGQTRARANVNINSPFTLGDQINLRSLATDENLFLGAVAYSAPIGADGLRGNIGYAYTSYKLGKDFASLQANGTSAVASAGVSYPIVRSQKANLAMSVSYQAKSLKDNKDSTNTHESKSSESVPISLQFDQRDSFGGGGITYGNLSLTSGYLNLDAALLAADTNNTRGSFNKLNLELVRIQALPAGFSAMGRLSLQGADKNLDSSEKFSLGGAMGVRAYPTGEASGDAGALAQLELRYLLASNPAFSPYLFSDFGTIQTNVNPPAGTTNNTRNISGLGLGVRYQRGHWNADASVAWRQDGGPPQSDAADDKTPRFLMSVGLVF